MSNGHHDLSPDKSPESGYVSTPTHSWGTISETSLPNHIMKFML